MAATKISDGTPITPIGTEYVPLGTGSGKKITTTQNIATLAANLIPNTQTTNYTLILTDNSKSVEMNAAGANTVTVPTNASVAFPIGAVITIVQKGIGLTTIIATGGVTITPSNTSLGLISPGQGSTMVLWQRAINDWDLWNGFAIPGNPFTKTDDTNVTATLGGSSTTAVLSAMSLTLGWTGLLAQSRGGVGIGNIASATTGTMNTDLTNTSTFTITPTGDCTFNLSGTEYIGQRTTFVITTSGTTSYKMTWGTGYKPNSVLSTGIISGVIITVSFNYDGTNMNEISRSYNSGTEIISTINTYTNYTTTATYQNITSIALTPGDWDISAFYTYSSNSATITAASNAIFVISTTTASASGSIEGLNIGYVPQAALLGTSKFSDSFPAYQVSPTSNTTYYLNTQATFTVGNPQFVGTIRARKIR